MSKVRPHVGFLFNSAVIPCIRCPALCSGPAGDEDCTGPGESVGSRAKLAELRVAS